MAGKTAGKPKGLLLDFPGAPCAPHVVGALPGVYRPDRPTPVGGVGEPSLEQAKAADADPGCPVKLVDIDPGDLDALRVGAASDRAAGREGE